MVSQRNTRDGGDGDSEPSNGKKQELSSPHVKRQRCCRQLSTSGIILFSLGCVFGHVFHVISDAMLRTGTVSTPLPPQQVHAKRRSSSGIATTNRSVAPSINTDRRIVNGDGWKTIQVYYGDISFFQEEAEKKGGIDFVSDGPGHKWYSQAYQDEHIIKLFRGKRNGYFLDLASNAPMYLSNTYALERSYGWTGLCVEANPWYWRGLTHIRTCQVVAAVVGGDNAAALTNQSAIEKPEPMLFDFQGGETGGIAKDGFDSSNQKARSEYAFAVPFIDILDRNQAPKIIDYLSLDVEGAEAFVMWNFPFDEYRITAISAERLSEQMEDLLKQNGYVFMKRLANFGETLWVLESEMPNLDVEGMMALPKGVKPQ